MHRIFGVDYFNTIPGPSNGQELLNFFHGVLDMQRDNGVRIILPGDALVMDNCGFHHDRITERLLRNMLESLGAQLIFHSDRLSTPTAGSLSETDFLLEL